MLFRLKVFFKIIVPENENRNINKDKSQLHVGKKKPNLVKSEFLLPLS